MTLKNMMQRLEIEKLNDVKETTMMIMKDDNDDDVEARYGINASANEQCINQPITTSSASTRNQNQQANQNKTRLAEAIKRLAELVVGQEDALTGMLARLEMRWEGLREHSG